MNTLDEDLINKITYSPECQATFSKYKNNLKKNITWDFGTIFIIPTAIFVLLYNIINNSKGTNGHLMPYIVLFVSISIMLFFWMKTVNSLINSIKDFYAKELDICLDIYSQTIVEQKQTGTSYQGIFQNLGKIEIPSKVASSFKPETKVYIIKSKYSQTVLDIIDENKI